MTRDARTDQQLARLQAQVDELETLLALPLRSTSLAYSRFHLCGIQWLPAEITQAPIILPVPGRRIGAHDRSNWLERSFDGTLEGEASLPCPLSAVAPFIPLQEPTRN
jgi:hypothetical protein